MAFYKHYSFDLWLTLIKSNPRFKQERTSYFYEKFNTKNKSIEEVALIFRQVDLMVNAINEKTGPVLVDSLLKREGYNFLICKEEVAKKLKLI